MKHEIMQGYQAQIEAAADQVVGKIEDAIVDRVVERLTTFLVGGGLQARVSSQLAPVHREFQQSLPASDTRGQGFGRQLKSAEEGKARDI